MYVEVPLAGLSSHRSQKRALYVYDPAAMHSIVVKDQYVYERSGVQIS